MRHAPGTTLRALLGESRSRSSPQNVFHMWRRSGASGRGPPSNGGGGQLRPLPHGPPFSSPGVQNSCPGPPRARTSALALLEGEHRALDLRRVHAVQQPRLVERGVGGADAVVDDEHAVARRVDELSREALHLRRVIGAGDVAPRVVEFARHVHRGLHPPQVPEVARTLEVLAAADGVPVARGVHALAAVVRRRQEVLAPEERLARLVDEHRVVGDGAPVVVEVVRALRVRVVHPAVDGQIALVVDDEVALVEVVMLGEVRSRVELDPGRVRPPAVAHHEVADAAEELRPRQLGVGGRPRVPRRDGGVAPQELEDGNGPLLGQPAALALDPGRERVLEAVDGVAEHDVVQGLQVRPLVVVVPRRRAVRLYLI